jgi:hypothetical protein
MYKIKRIYFSTAGMNLTIKSGLNLEQAQKHCCNPETSSSTCKSSKNKTRTRRYGPWMDVYEEQ